MLDHVGQVLVGGADDADVHIREPVPPNPANLPFLQDPKKLGLQRKGNVADLVKKARSAVGFLKEASPRGYSPGKGPFLVAKKLALEEMFGKGGAVDGNEGPGGPGTVGVNAPGDEFLAGPTFPHDQNVGLTGCDLLDQVVNLDHGTASAHDVFEPVGLGELLPQAAVFVEQPSLGQSTLDDHLELVCAERFGNIVEGSFLHRLHRRLHRGEGGEEDDQCLGIDASNGSEDL